MSLSLHTVLVPDFLRGLRALSGVLVKAEAHCEAKGLAHDEITAARLAEDMFDFSYQVKSARVHSLGALEGAKAGSFSPDMGKSPAPFEAQQAMLAEAIAAIEALAPADVNALEGGETVFRIGDREMPFATEDFLLSFSLPNFYFHIATAYDITRWKGVPVGKRDYLGAMRLKTTA